MNIFGFDYYLPEKSAALEYSKKWKWKPARLDVIKNPAKLLKFKSSVDIFLEKKFSKGYSLIISRKIVQTGALIDQLKKKKKPYVFLNWDEFISEGTVCYDSSTKKYSLNYKKHSFDLSKVKSVYFDHSDISEVLFFKRAKFSNKEKIFLNRWMDSLMALELLIKKAQWFPAAPSKLRYDSQNKFGELLQAQKMGLKTPKMIYTNDSRAAQKFLLDYPSVMKESGIKFIEKGEYTLLFRTKKINPLDRKLVFVNSAPCMFQEYIEKKFEVRSVVIEDKVLSSKILSQEQESLVDWRGKEHLAKFVPFTLPKKIEKKLIRFARELGFQFASFDLVVDKKGDYYFLEMNRPGQWFFVEALSGIPIAKTLAQKF
jgi:hypothetical protein